MKPRVILLYGVLLLISFLLLAMMWHWQMAGNYFICKDHGIILDFLPPFAHTGVSGDIYLKPVNAIYTIWSVYIGAILIVPGVCVWLINRLYERDLKQSWAEPGR